MKNKKYVTASKIGDFVYYKSGWWLQFNELTPTTKEMLAGTKAHENLSTALHTNTKNIKMAWVIIVSALVLLAALLVLGK